MQIQLEEMDLVQLNQAEKQEVVGGIAPWLVRAGWAIAGYIGSRVLDAAVDDAASKMYASIHPKPGMNLPHNACDNV
ncbi:hypothetical protein [Sediminibacterium sp.]|jgi:hypothetical protein|uniref:hypothetical protein n=1 Tax=Sediminibacterium sp. TaxID=1917865 RepID=UPI0027168300|nr:hypothetical protein [Sediminibacterium sp.]MDO8995009.1 hypothetical protein [Sediminibacterium sp.]MDO9156892.1 hypothetical protein [Sediminibacterium sp.]MDP2420825.1 hypothetical protein [Sediminibacterium sp.]